MMATVAGYNILVLWPLLLSCAVLCQHVPRQDDQQNQPPPQMQQQQQPPQMQQQQPPQMQQQQQQPPQMQQQQQQQPPQMQQQQQQPPQMQQQQQQQPPQMQQQQHHDPQQQQQQHHEQQQEQQHHEQQQQQQHHDPQQQQQQHHEQQQQQQHHDPQQQQQQHHEQQQQQQHHEQPQEQQQEQQHHEQQQQQQHHEQQQEHEDQQHQDISTHQQTQDFRQPPPPVQEHVVQRVKKLPYILVPSEINEFDSSSISFVFSLPSRKKQCFYHRALSNFRFDYQVTTGGNLDIDVFINSPQGKLVFDRRGKSMGEKDFEVDTPHPSAAYMMCFDNRYSSWNDKSIYVSIDVPLKRAARPSADQIPEDAEKQLRELELTWDEFYKSTDKVEDYLLRSLYHQTRSKNYEQMDWGALQANYSRVNFWSFINLGVMIFTATVQVMMIRALFDDQSRLGKLIKKKPTSIT